MVKIFQSKATKMAMKYAATIFPILEGIYLCKGGWLIVGVPIIFVFTVFLFLIIYADIRQIK